MKAQAETQNAIRLSGYTQACADWIAANVSNRDLGLTLTDLPIKPKKQVVDAVGNVTEVTWEGLTTPVLPEQGLASSSSIKATTNVPMDRLDQVIACLSVLNEKLDKIVAKVGA